MAARASAFFKSISSQDCFDRIQIAPGYVNYTQGKLPSRVILRDQHGNHWHVHVEKHENKFFFTEAWEKFVNENHVEVGDFIVFYYDTLNVFDIVLLGHNSCEKEGVGGPKTEVVGGQGENEIEEQEDIIEINDDEGEVIEVFKKEIQKKTMSGASGKGLIIKDKNKSEDGRTTAAKAQHGNEINILDMDVDEDEGRSTDEFDKEVQNPNLGASGKCKIIKKVQSGHGRASTNKVQHGNKTEGGRGGSIFQERNMSAPKNPYFVTKIRRERRNQMLIPAYLIKEHNLHLPKYMLLQDTQGKEWYTKLTTWQDRRKWYFGGWLSLCKENLVQHNDFLVCEFVKIPNNKLFLKVQILRE